jgi:class 3 adenylate cyclase/tetratricopeptide (TPR) repeat protein
MASGAAAARKTVTVLFCDLVDSTGLGEQLDPERLRELLARWYDRMRAPIERHGGTVEKFIGDAVMAVFGVPHVHEDDALRAVLAAVEMHAAVEPPLRIRIGINTGPVVAGDGTTTLVSGDAVNTAKRLEEAAAPGTTLIGAATRQLVANAVELDGAGAIAAKGKQQPVESWRVVGAIPGAAPFARRLDAALVGRAEELAFLRAQLAAVERDGTCALVTVLGNAGVGKSRLARELLAEAAGRALVLSARCLPYGDGVSFLPVDDLVHSLGGEDSVLSAVAEEPDGDLIVRRLCGGGTTAEELQWALRRLLESLARERPLVACIEDVHWAEPAFLDLLEYVAGWSRAPILLLCLARPDLLDVRPRWGGAALALAPLSESESRSLLESLAAEWPVDATARDEVVRAAEGNPLFLEQMVAMLAEGNAADDVPPTVQALLAARLDSLAPAERAALERASVVGRDFSRAEVAELSSGDERAALGPTLMSLVRKELVQPAQSPHAGDDGFRFRHALIRDAAYAEIPKRVAAELHERFADWLGRRDGPPEIAGYHLDQAYRCREQLGERDEALAARAGAVLAEAGERAFARDDASAAAKLFARACELLPRRDDRRLPILRHASLALFWTGSVEEARTLLEEAIAAATAAGDRSEEWSARLDLAAGDLVTGRGDADALLAVAEEAVDALAPDDDAALARAWRRISYAHLMHSRYALAAESAERALAHARSAGEHFEEARIVDLLCTSLLWGPTAAGAAIERCGRMLAEAEGNPVMTANVASSLAGLQGMVGDFEAARRHGQLAETIFLELGLQLAFVGLTQVTGPVELLAGDARAAERVLRQGLEIIAPRGSDGFQQALLAEALYRQGRYEEAAECVRVAAEKDGEGVTVSRVTWRSVRAKLEASEELAREALALAETTDATNLIADALVDLAIVVGDREDIPRAVELYERKGNVAALARISDLLPAAIRSADAD